VTPTRRIGCVLLPFAAGYYLSYLFRSINALIAADLVADMRLTATELGLLTAVFFLVFAAAQIPFGILLDRHGPRTLQATLLLLASAGSLLFALADTLYGLLIGRALIGIGVALALMAGFKAIVLWFPAERLALVNGAFVMLGALGAVTASAPAEAIMTTVGWRGLFAVLGLLSAAAALLVVAVVPDCRLSSASASHRINLLTVYRDRRFWRLAPLSAIGIGTSWSLQGLWAAPWLQDVDGLDRRGVVEILSLMGIVVSASGGLLGLAANHVRRKGRKTEHVLLAAVGASIAAQLALLLGLPVAPSIAWSAIAATGAATVLSYAILAEDYPIEVSGRANAALNLLHVGTACILQTATGLILEQWPAQGGCYPVEAHHAALGFTVVLQLAALAWFALAPIATRPSTAIATLVDRRGCAHAGLAAQVAILDRRAARLAWQAGSHALARRDLRSPSKDVPPFSVQELPPAMGSHPGAPRRQPEDSQRADRAPLNAQAPSARGGPSRPLMATSRVAKRHQPRHVDLAGGSPRR
jgi:MFS family permease